MHTYPPPDNRHQPDSPHQQEPAMQFVSGTGPIGLTVIDHLVDLGINVRAVNRSGVAPVPAGVTVVGGDASDRGSATSAG